MKLSIIVPIYDAEKHLDECVCSLFDQELRHEDFEVLLIDDGSTDSSLTIANKWATVHNNVKVFHQENQGQAAARNLGLDNAKGKYVMFVDSDDFLYKNTLLEPLKCISKNEYDCVHFGMGVEQENGVVHCRHIKGVKYRQTYSGEFVAQNLYLFGSVCSYIFKTNLFKSNHIEFKSGFAHEDCELCFRLFPMIKSITFVENLVYHYRYNHNSTDRSKSIKSIRRKYNSDLLIAAEINNLILNGVLSSALRQRYRRISNSMVASHYLSYLKNPDLFDTKESYYCLVKRLGLFPLKGPGMSFGSTMLLLFLNFKFMISMRKS